MPNKTIRGKADLAINGAQPAFAEPLHVGRPNIGDRAAFLARVERILDNRWLTNNGPMVRELEQRSAGMAGVRHCGAMCNATIALEIAIRALNLRGEVIVPSYTFIATAHALHWQEIVPVFADIDPATHNLDPDAVLRMITPRTTGIIGVHLWGRPAPVEALQAIADERGLTLLFDSAHAFGCSHRGRPIGGFGACEVFSFHATKFFNSFEGGAVVTNDDELAEKLRLMRNFGFAGYDNAIHPGTNGKMTEICAAMALVNMDALPAFLDANRRRYYEYAAALKGIDGLRMMEYDDASGPNYQYIVVEVDRDFPANRDEIVATLQAENILARRYFWPGCHGMKPYRDLYPHARMMLPCTEKVAASVIVLPTGSTLPDDSIGVIAAICKVLGQGRA